METKDQKHQVAQKRPELVRPEKKTKDNGAHVQKGLTSGSQKTKPPLKHQKLEERVR